MKKILLSLLILATSLNVMATDFAVATLTLKGNTSLEQGEVTLVKTDDPVASSYCAPLYINQYHVVMYALNNSEKYQIWANADLTNLPLGFKTYSDENYTITVSNVSGSETLILRDLSNNEEYSLVNNAVIEFSAAANSTIEDRFVINYVAPAPACTTIRENMEVGHYYTICIPQDIVSFNGASFWSMSNRGEGVAYIVEVAAPLTAGQPYIIPAEAEELCVVYGNAVPAPEAGTAGALVGTFGPMEQAALDAAATAASSDIYLLYNNELWKVNGQSGNSLPANRAYVVYDNLIPENPAPAPGRRVRAIPMQGQVATGIETLNAADAPAKTIIDGKLYIIRDKHMFDATGRMVK